MVQISLYLLNVEDDLGNGNVTLQYALVTILA